MHQTSAEGDGQAGNAGGSTGVAHGCRRTLVQTCEALRRAGTKGPAPPLPCENHSRFHPVPTQPVFLPRTDELPPVPESLVREPGGPRSAAAGEKPLQIESTPQAPTPVDISAPKPDGKNDRETAPRRLSDAAPTPKSSSWVFAPSAPEQPEKPPRVAGFRILTEPQPAAAASGKASPR